MLINNQVKIIFLFVLFSIPVPAIVFLIFGDIAGGISLLVFLFLSYILYRYSGKILLRWYRAEKVASLENISKKAEISPPDMYLFDHPLPLIFTVGTGGRYAVALSSEAMDMFDKSELEILFAHEIGHIKNGDVQLNTLVALFAGSFAAVSTLALWGALFMGFGQNYDPAPRFIRFFSMGLVAPPAALVAQLLVACSREHVADETAVELTGNSQMLVESLERLKHQVDLNQVGVNPGHAHMFPLNVLHVTELYDIHLLLFNTHPSLESRSNRLKEASKKI